MTLLEAMAAGIPAIATRVGAVPSVIEHQKTGLLVEPGKIEPLQCALEQLLEAPQLQLSLGCNGQAWVRAHASIETTAEKYAKHYRDLLASAA